ncbi:HpcH/HpaI aldolase/citrate lyase family protein [Pelagicoccus sp. SDUM812002]|uniref:HpcH/HpaI aldolase/citrate lyase family protein n=1 Tax=Pelagicoccus sp. SDUM812002 TaxID=3041266 RepID=UPI00280C96FB|nr:HpcH/HpaI aldolase/citrate lyase family protein [Pelagicoccus sp. SDUM812002]MDQ8186286.1 HpcH/HpaI aldolase/citrate lyase family protein [Pelagicoccus sp. SDUM812002]
MRHHTTKRDFPFVKEPVKFDKDTEKSLLQYCLGATLYMPGTKSVVGKILARRLDDLSSMVFCLEDAIEESALAAAETNVLVQLNEIANALKSNLIARSEVPLIFIRVRNTDQFIKFSNLLTIEQADALTGFVFPKFYSNNAYIYLEQLGELNLKLGILLYGMPILEGRTIAFRESRVDELNMLKTVLKPFRKWILNIRVGGTDFSSLFGVRRGINSSIYDILPVRDCLSDILNYFNRAEDGYIVSAPVWEYFLAYVDENLEHLLSEDIHRSLLNRNPIVNEAIDGLLREVLIDKANGFVGKTVIHPSHLKYVNAMQAITAEEYEDALQILEAEGGVVKSAKANKMNEISPHRNWAKKINSCAQAYGVIESETDYIKLILEP